jgi:hypothetical protein
MKSKLLLTFTVILVVVIPTSVLAQSFVPLVGIPGVDPNDPSLGTYINAIYRLAISLAALLAVIKIVFAGAKYMLTDIVPGKEEAKKDIQGALIGLLIVLAAVLILTTVNSDLTKTDLLITPITVPDKPEPVRTAIDIFRESCEEGNDTNNCMTTNCSFLINNKEIPYALKDNLSCEEICTAISGIYFATTDSILLSGGNCGFLRSNFDSYVLLKKPLELQEMINRNTLCSSDEVTCVANYCQVSELTTWEALFTSGCEYKCTTIQGGFFDSVTSGCVVVNVNEEVVLQNQLERARTKLCTAGAEYICEVALCPLTNLFSSCAVWCNADDTFGGGAYDTETNACYKQIGFTNSPYTCSDVGELSCEEVTNLCLALPNYVSVQMPNANTIICTTD